MLLFIDVFKTDIYSGLYFGILLVYTYTVLFTQLFEFFFLRYIYL